MQSSVPVAAVPVVAGPVAGGAEPVGVPTWAWLVLALSGLAIYALTLENGLVLKAGAETVHELFHDGRHFFGVPCH